MIWIKNIILRGVIGVTDRDLQVLQFRGELIKLCDKYNCSICGSYNDWNDDYVIEFKDKDYMVSAKGISVYDYDVNDNRKYIADEFILNLFNDGMREMQGLNNVKVRYILFSNDNIKANKKMEQILETIMLSDDKCRVMRVKDGIKEIRIEDGTRYVWVKPSDNSRGYRCNHAFIDRNLSLEIIENHVMPVAFYCGKDTVEIF